MQTQGFLDAELEAVLEINSDLIFEVVELRARHAAAIGDTGFSAWSAADDTVTRTLTPLFGGDQPEAPS